MEKFIKFLSGFIGWLFTDPVGVVFQGIVWGAVMTTGTHFSGAFAEYGALAYCVAFFLTFFTTVILAFIAGWIWAHISYRLCTSRPTFIKFTVKEWRLHVVEKGNVHKIPYIKSLDEILMPPPDGYPRNRKELKASQAKQKKNQLPQNEGVEIQPNPYAQPVHRALQSIIIIQFQVPISPATMHFQLHHDGGAAPTLGDHSIDERWALVILSNMKEGTSFTLHFNDQKP